MIKECLVKGSILHALDEERLSREIEENKKLSVIQRVFKGCIYGVGSFICKSFITPVIFFGISKIFDSNNSTEDIVDLGICEIGIVAPCLEESSNSLFHVGLKFTHLMAKEVAPSFLQETRVFKWLTFPTARVLMVNTLFASIHLLTAGGYQSTAGAVTQCIRIMLFPTYSILYETTWGLIAPIAAHMTNNLLAFGAFKVIRLLS